MCSPEVMPYEVGKFYTVQCVHAALYSDIGWWPVMGEAHRDTEIIGFIITSIGVSSAIASTDVMWARICAANLSAHSVFR